MFISFEVLNEANIKNTKHKDVFVVIKSLLFILIMMIMLSGCSSYGIKGSTNQLKQDEYQSNLEKSFILYNPGSLWTVELVDSSFNETTVNGSIDKAKIPAQHYQNSVGGISGLIGTILATQIIRESSSAVPVRSVYGTDLEPLSDYDSGSIKKILSEIFSIPTVQIYEKSDSISEDLTSDAGSNYVTMIYPSFHFSKKYRVLKTNFLVEILNSDSEIVFRNYYSYSSKPIDGEEKQCVKHWMDNEIALLKAYGKEAVNELVHMLEQDSLSGKTLLPKEHAAMRYKNIIGEHYLRGGIIAKEQNRVMMRTLRGHVCSAYVDNYL